MTPDEFPPSLTKVRRKDRAVEDDEWIKNMLRREPFGVLATAADGQPFAMPNIFVYDEARHTVYTHTAKAGRTRSNVDGADRACFTVSTMGRLLPAATALEMSVEYESVVVFGRAEVVADPAEAEAALRLLLDKYFPHLQPGRDYREIRPEELARTAVYRLTVERWSGKREAVSADFPGAFRFGHPPNFTAGPTPPLSEDTARQFADAWVAAWNARDLDAILAHYADDVDYASPFITALTGEPTGTLRGTAALRPYFAAALARYPDLQFRLRAVTAGVASVVLVYDSVNGLLAAETFELDAAKRAIRVRCHYAQADDRRASPTV